MIDFGRPWTPEEDAVIINATARIAEVARALGRTEDAIRRRRQKLARSGAALARTRAAPNSRVCAACGAPLNGRKAKHCAACWSARQTRAQETPRQQRARTILRAADRLRRERGACADADDANRVALLKAMWAFRRRYGCSPLEARHAAAD